MKQEEARTLLMSFDEFVFWCAPCHHCKNIQQIPEAGSRGEAMTMIDCIEPKECYCEHEHRLKAEREYEEFLNRREEIYLISQEEHKRGIDEWIDDPEMMTIWAYEQLGRIPYDKYEEMISETERRPTKSNCLFRV